MGYVQALKCRECGREYPKGPINICEFCFGPLEVVYQYDEIAKVLSREKIAARPPDMWRYRELLPLDEAPTVGKNVGYTPLVRAENLARKLGVSELYLKNDAVSYPTLSFKDRVVAVAVSKAKEFGFDTIACASTGNLANAVAACASSAGLKSYVFIPADLEQGKIMGTQVFGTNLVGVEGNYDDVNRLCTEVADQHRWAFVNINLRPFYAEGSKTFGYEIAEQLGWRLPQNVVVPMAGGSLITKLKKSFQELTKIGLVEETPTKMFGAQAAGCSPIVTAVKKGTDLFRPVKPDTIAKSLAIGNPADGYYAIRTMTDSGGWGEEVTDDEIVEAIKLLAETEGIFTETAGGVTLGSAKKLIEQGKIPRDESIVISITGNGLKTQEALLGRLHHHPVIDSRLASFEALLLENQARL